jgi:hypothetical protein
MPAAQVTTNKAGTGEREGKTKGCKGKRGVQKQREAPPFGSASRKATVLDGRGYSAGGSMSVSSSRSVSMSMSMSVPMCTSVPIVSSTSIAPSS